MTEEQIKEHKKQLARNMLWGLVARSGITFEQKCIELARINGSDECLLEYIDMAIGMLEDAKKEIEDEN